ncbi:T9SS type A sorting domain-containing protein [Reichenbachiella sp. MALMAid0571]|uniref:T9SS type A sorting domain-containing protein n=1 Tax=Reichenbachiella sp. MALMAid0571 TaxID=3143939 RepID=UPI0032DE62EA
MMKPQLLYIIFLFFVFTFQYSKAQNTKSEYLVRSSIGITGSSVISSKGSKTYTIQQSVGQASITGTFSTTQYTIRQGFIQPDVLSKILDKDISLELESNFYPNPFVESATLAFNETITGKVEVSVFDTFGRLVFYKDYEAEKNLKIRFQNLPEANYILKVIANEKQFVKHIRKK